MKARAGFVSNSSSTSFTCELCNATESGYDSAGIEDFGFFRCRNDHTICFDCVPENEVVEHIDDDDEGYYGVDPAVCPICSFEIPSNKDMAVYLLRMTGIPRETAFAEIKKVNRRRRKLYDFEYVAYVVRVQGLDINAVLAGLRDKFDGDYAEFLKSLHGVQA